MSVKIARRRKRRRRGPPSLPPREVSGSTGQCRHSKSRTTRASVSQRRAAPQLARGRDAARDRASAPAGLRSAPHCRRAGNFNRKTFRLRSDFGSAWTSDGAAMQNVIEPPQPLTIRNIRAVGTEVPMTFALGTSRQAITKAPMLLVDLETDEGVTGRAYLWCYFRQAMTAIASVLDAALEALKGEVVAPLAIEAKLSKRFALIGKQGIVRMAVAAIDMAAWDALAQSAGLPLATMLGSRPTRIPAYNSCGLGLMPVAELQKEADALLARGFRAVKLRLGYPTLADDLAAVRAVKKVIL